MVPWRKLTPIAALLAVLVIAVEGADGRHRNASLRYGASASHRLRDFLQFDFNVGLSGGSIMESVKFDEEVLHRFSADNYVAL